MAAVVAVWIDVANREHGERRGIDLQRQAIREEAAMLRDTVLTAPYTSVDTLRTYGDDALDTLGANVFRARFPGRAAADDAYAEKRHQLLASPEDWHNVRVTVDLLPSPTGPVAGLGSMFMATIEWKYRTVPTLPVLRFVCVTDENEYYTLAHDPQVTVPWWFGRAGTWDAGTPDVFQLLTVTADDHDCPIKRTQHTGSQTYTAALPAGVVDAGREVAVMFTYRVLVARLGRYLFITTPRPTEGFEVRLNYSAAGIWKGKLVPFLPGLRRPSITKTSAASPSQSMEISLSQSIPPGCGAEFHWILNDDTTRPDPAEDHSVG